MPIRRFSFEEILDLAYPDESFQSRPAPTVEEARALMEQIGEDKELINAPTVYEVNGIPCVGDGHRRFAAIKLAIAEDYRPVLDLPFFESGGAHFRVESKSELSSLLNQISANASTKPPTNAQYAKSLLKCLTMDPNLTREDLARKTGLSVKRLDQILSLNSLPEEAQKLNNEGNMPLTQAIALATIPRALVDEELEKKACTQSSTEFSQTIADKKEQIRKDRLLASGGRNPSREFIPEKKLRTKQELEELFISAQSMFDMETADGSEASTETKARLDFFKEIFSLDEKTVSEARTAFEKNKLEKEKAAALRRKQRSDETIANVEKTLAGFSEEE